MTEFSIINDYFKNKTSARSDVMLGIGDDAALLQVPPEQLLVCSMDTLVAGVHFFEEINAYDIGYKALAVNLSDLAAMGAEPAWMTLALTMPSIDVKWLDGFTAGLFDLAKQFNVQLIGGDTTQGPLTMTIQLHGFVPPKQALCRRGAKVGDKIYVSGTLGDAGLGLEVMRGTRTLSAQATQYVLQRLHQPMPQVKLGILLRQLATSAIDISDGLLADLGHILTASQVGADIITKHIPLSYSEALHYALTAGDDYELCFTVSVENEDKLMSLLARDKIRCTCIGEIRREYGINLLDYTSQIDTAGYRHF